MAPGTQGLAVLRPLGLFGSLAGYCYLVYRWVRYEVRPPR